MAKTIYVSSTSFGWTHLNLFLHRNFNTDRKCLWKKNRKLVLQIPRIPRKFCIYCRGFHYFFIYARELWLKEKSKRKKSNKYKHTVQSTWLNRNQIPKANKFVKLEKCFFPYQILQHQTNIQKCVCVYVYTLFFYITHRCTNWKAA